MRQSQCGNILPYVAALLIAIAFSVQYVYNSYKSSNESTRLQNTVDSAAYSTAVVSAQTYNFIALSNRSLVANQITAAQLATTVSWVRMLRTFVGTVKSVAQYIPYVGQFVMAVDYYVDLAQQIVEEAMPAFLKGIATYMDAISFAQYSSTIMTAVVSEEVLQSVIEKNDPDVNMSVATLASFAGQVTTQLNSWSRNDCPSEADDSSTQDNDTRVRCRRFRSIMLDSRDGLTRDRVYDLGPTIDLAPGQVIPKGFFGLNTWIKMVRGRGTTMTGQSDLTPFRTWSALDTVSLHVKERYLQHSGFRIRTRTKDFGEVVKLGSGGAVAGNDDCGSDSSCYVVHDKKAYWKINPMASSCVDVYQHSTNVANIILDILSFGELSCEELTDHDADDVSSGAELGIKPFYDLNDKGIVSDKDHIMVYLRKSRRALNLYSNTGFGSGSSQDTHIDRDGGAQMNNIHAAGAAKVFFRRDNDAWMLSGARRLDGRIEFGNAYNPYWEVSLDRLTDTDKLSVTGFKALTVM